MKPKLSACILATALIAGCSGSESDDTATSPSETPPTIQPPPPPPPPTAPPKMVQEEATPGVGKKGRGYGTGPVATPIAAYFRTRQRIVFNIQIQPTMNLYKAQHGHFPKSHDEFIKEIIKKNRIQLPELPEGHRYVYDPNEAKLMVEHP